MEKGLVVISDRGGHLHDLLSLVGQMGVTPEWLITTVGPDVSHLKTESRLRGTKLGQVPQAFSWIGKKRIWNPFRFAWHLASASLLLLRTRPRLVISTGATNVVPFCYLAKLVGARICHVENLAQVVNASVTGRMLYPIATDFYVQWKELLSQYGPKARYEGTVV